jgi:hypothetical protein
MTVMAFEAPEPHLQSLHIVPTVPTNTFEPAPEEAIEMVAETKAATLGTDVRRQVSMGDSEIDFDLIVAGKRRGFEIKGWTTKTWREALDAAVKRIVEGKSKLTAHPRVPRSTARFVRLAPPRARSHASQLRHT